MLYRTKGSDWWNAYWRLGRKIERQLGVPTANDVRLAAVLRQLAARSAVLSSPPLPHSCEAATTLRTACDSMEWVIDYGTRRFEEELAARKAQAHLDHDPGDTHA